MKLKTRNVSITLFVLGVLFASSTLLPVGFLSNEILQVRATCTKLEPAFKGKVRNTFNDLQIATILGDKGKIKEALSADNFQSNENVLLKRARKAYGNERNVSINTAVELALRLHPYKTDILQMLLEGGATPDDTLPSTVYGTPETDPTPLERTARTNNPKALALVLQHSEHARNQHETYCDGNQHCYDNCIGGEHFRFVGDALRRAVHNNLLAIARVLVKHDVIYNLGENVRQYYPRPPTSRSPSSHALLPPGTYQGISSDASDETLAYHYFTRIKPKMWELLKEWGSKTKSDLLPFQREIPFEDKVKILLTYREKKERNLLDKHRQSALDENRLNTNPQKSWRLNKKYLNSSTCGICHGSLLDKEEWIINECGHPFCKNCIDQWLPLSQNKCPYCQKKCTQQTLLEPNLADHHKVLQLALEAEKKNNEESDGGEDEQ